VNTSSDSILDDEITQLLLRGEANDSFEAERIYLDRNLDKVIDLVNSPISDETLRKHRLIQLLLAHGSRPWEDSVL
jgi:hypothetical protein